MKYICRHFIPGDDTENRYHALSSNDKADYIGSVLNEAGRHVEVISPTWTQNTSGYYPRRIDKLNDGCDVVSAPTFGISSGMGRILQKICLFVWTIFYLIRNCRKGEVILAYHGLFFALPLIILRKIKKIRIILEVEEIFSELGRNTSSWRIWLERAVIRSASAYIFASRELEEACNSGNRPYTIANGRYEAIQDINADRVKSILDDKKVVLVYAGLIKEKKAAFQVARIAEYLGAGYEIRIIGYGSEKDIKALQDEAQRVNQKSECKIRYDGIKRGEEYNAYLQECDIGLCPLTDDISVQKACFPSKITSYLSNGLNVVTTENPVVRGSAYKDYIVFVPDDLPVTFAREIDKIEYGKMKDPRELIRQMDRQFAGELAQLIHQIGR